MPVCESLDTGIRRIIQPTIPPMVRAPYTNLQPDFVVTGPDFAWKVRYARPPSLAL